jgi:hypothetical protein
LIFLEGEVDDELAGSALVQRSAVSQRVLLRSVGLVGRTEEESHWLGTDAVEEGERCEVEETVG